MPTPNWPNWLLPMFKKPPGPRVRPREVARIFNEIAVDGGKPVRGGVIDRLTASDLYAQSKLFIIPEALKEVEICGVMLRVVDRHPKFPDVPILIFHTVETV